MAGKQRHIWLTVESEARLDYLRSRWGIKSASAIIAQALAGAEAYEREQEQTE